MTSLRTRTRKPKGETILAPARPNAGLEASYRRKLEKLVDEMGASVSYFVKAAYRSNEPEMAQDETPAEALRRKIAELRDRWFGRFDKAAEELAAYFATAVSKRSDAVLKSILKRGGFSIEFRMTPAQKDIFQATVAENVSLIKSIPQQYLTQVEGMVMRSVQAGRDIGQLSKDLQEQLGVTRRRAALIARDQNNKATAVFTRARQLESGITEAVWLHSRGGNHPRPTHVAMSGKKYDIAKGMWDPAENAFTWPGALINCRCVCKPVIKGFS